MHERNEDGFQIPKNALVKVTRMKHIIEVQFMEKMNRTNHIKKLSKDTYVDMITGEIKDFEHSETRKDNENSLRQTFKRLRYLINGNFEGRQNELHVTLTYKKNMTDTKQLYSDYNKFIKRLKYAYKDETTIDYLTVVEPQGRGAWHCHALIRFNEMDKIYVKNSILRDLWGHGFVTIKSLKDVDNIGAYLSAYLTDVELTEETVLKAITSQAEVVIRQVEGQEKKFIKGGRLSMYPPGMNLYRKSKGIVLPEREEMKYEDTKKVVGSAKPHYQKSYHIENDGFENTIAYEQYNTKRL